MELTVKSPKLQAVMHLASSLSQALVSIATRIALISLVLAIVGYASLPRAKSKGGPARATFRFQ